MDHISSEEPVQEKEIIDEPVEEEDSGEGTGLVLAQLDFDDSATEPMSDDSDDSDEEENIPFLFEEIQYEREPGGDQSVYDEDGDTVGSWDGEKINFLSANLRKEHEKKIYELGGNLDTTPKSTEAEDYLKMATKDLRKMAKTYGIAVDDIDDAGDTEDPKGALINLIRNSDACVLCPQ